MQKRDQFQIQFKRLMAHFGANKITGEFCDVVYPRISFLGSIDFQKVVDTLIANRPASKPPTLAEIITESKKLRRQVAQSFVQAQDPTPDELLDDDQIHYAAGMIRDRVKGIVPDGEFDQGRGVIVKGKE